MRGTPDSLTNNRHIKEPLRAFGSVQLAFGSDQESFSSGKLAFGRGQLAFGTGQELQ